jgi:ATP-dependent helicase YprA (DUF1998 family)
MKDYKMEKNITVIEAIKKLHHSLKEYIEATYHISHPSIIQQRKRILDEVGVISQKPFIESTPKYKSGEIISNLKIGKNAKLIFSILSQDSTEFNKIIFDPLYEHQSKSIEKTLGEGKSLLIMTGTGSGKTECFLLPILGKLAEEAAFSQKSFKQHAVRAILLYPMNALVNDQLGRLRKFFADPRCVNQFIKWSDRPVTFARYTSRTLYPGVRSAKSDQLRLKPIRDFYINLLERSQNPSDTKQQEAVDFIGQLKERGKWPGKNDLITWYGKDRDRWQDSKSHQFKRCVTLKNDSELLTRHEVLENPPDILVTNYSMLEYMLMRPIEIPIFEKTATWLKNNPNEKLYLIVDEAHLYRGAAGTEVAYLIRRLINRLGITCENVQVICTSASFNDTSKAKSFTSELTSIELDNIEVIQGSLDLKKNVSVGNEIDARILASIDSDSFYDEIDESNRVKIIEKFLDHRKVLEKSSLEHGLYKALIDYAPLNLLINTTMRKAVPLAELQNIIFPNIENDLAAKAITNLISLSSMARIDKGTSSLFPCRVHSMHRGLPGLWACIDKECTLLLRDEKGGPIGKLYSQPREYCECGSKVYELFTCRNCGTAYARAYSDDIKNPSYLWSTSGLEMKTIGGKITSLNHLDMLLENPKANDLCDEIDIDLRTGRINPLHLSGKTRRVYLKTIKSNEDLNDREFSPCGVCKTKAGYQRTPVQDHQTKGDQPFLALISRQIQIQPPNPTTTATSFAPLRGRKVLIFSDSRQMAARLAPNLKTLSMKDAIRPLLVFGFQKLISQPQLASLINLEDSFFAVVVASFYFNIRLRPELIEGENFLLEHTVFSHLRRAPINDLNLLIRSKSIKIPNELFKATHEVLYHDYYGLESLGLASISSKMEFYNQIDHLPDLPDFEKYFFSKIDLVNLWIHQWGIGHTYFNQMPLTWKNDKIKSHSGNFSAIEKLLQKKLYTNFKKLWLPELLKIYCQQDYKDSYFLNAQNLVLGFSSEWNYCDTCKTIQRPFFVNSICINCGDITRRIDVQTDTVFKARKSFYRSSTINAFKEPPEVPFALTTAEHSAQLNSTQENQNFSITENYELLFQDINIALDDNAYAIDVLSCTTTMEVGIDIGTLSGVALRNMPPSRANYQQRAGRAGRRGNALATVISFASSDSHDDHFFKSPESLISGVVDDPILFLDNYDIIKRHLLSYLLQQYYFVRLQDQQVNENTANLFEVLGTVTGFLDSNSLINKKDFISWLVDNKKMLQKELNSWIPDSISTKTKSELITNFISEAQLSLDFALGQDENQIVGAEVQELENMDFSGETTILSQNLLERLLYKGVLPKYAFPTDIAPFFVFDNAQSTPYRHIYKYSPGQSLSIALSQNAPGKSIWIDNKKWFSGAIYSPFIKERIRKWNQRKIYYECSNCHFAATYNLNEGTVGETRDCQACASPNSFGPAKIWFTPPGFAHPIDMQEETASDNDQVLSYASRAKLIAQSPVDWTSEEKITDNIYFHFRHDHLLVTNTGSLNQGFNYCASCGRIEPSIMRNSKLIGNHLKPYPDRKESECTNPHIFKNISLGTDFISDVFLILFDLKSPVRLLPGMMTTDIVLRTVCEALVKAATLLLELEEGEILAEYRPALTSLGAKGEQIEVYLYDTLAGGAGFSKRAMLYKRELIETALSILQNCSNDCDSSCYGCLRSYKNKLEHHLLDRQLGSDLLNYLLHNEIPKLDRSRLENTANILYNDLLRESNIDFKLFHTFEVPGIGNILAPIYFERDKLKYIIDIHNPITPNIHSIQNLEKLKNYTLGQYQILLFDETVVKKNLPSITSSILGN